VRRWIDEGYLVAKGVPLAAVTYLELADMAAERIYLACQRVAGGERRVKAILDPYNPRGSSRFVNFTTSKDVRTSDPRKSQVNAVVCDSTWEAELARVIERNPHVLAYVKNQGLNFEVPYRDGATARRYLPDFVVRIDDGGDEPLNLILQTKGYRGADAQLKAETMKTLWVPGVNNLGTQGRWAFAEFTDPFEIQRAFDEIIENLIVKVPA
jgi:type III restriction enzyme